MSAREARVLAHAKLNLRLKVLGREAGGYHTIETLLLRIALADGVTVRAASRGQALRMSGDDALVAAAGPRESNLAFRAAVTYADVTGWPRGFELEVEKHIPVGAGLGGGSADAGAVLIALQALAPEPVAQADLLRIAASLGADVPFMVTGHPLALGWSRGDRLLPLSALPQRDVVLLTPTFSVSTRDAYAWLDSTREDLPVPPAELTWGATGSWESAALLSENDFEVPVISRHPEIAAMLGSLSKAGARIARMSGTGSTVFGVFEGAVTFDSAGAEQWQVHSTRTLSSVVPPELGE